MNPKTPMTDRDLVAAIREAGGVEGWSDAQGWTCATLRGERVYRRTLDRLYRAGQLHCVSDSGRLTTARGKSVLITTETYSAR